MTRPLCETCAYWAGERAEVDGLGTCRMTAPRSNRDQTLPAAGEPEPPMRWVILGRGDWPWVRSDEWCGQHQAAA